MSKLLSEYLNFKNQPASVDGTPSDFRFARKPNGKLILQGAYAWRSAGAGGLEWRDIPVVDVDEDGNEVD